MEKDKIKPGSERAGQEGKGENEEKNPFKNTSVPDEKEDPVEDAEAEQQRKDALTERD
jgi:hypothetical protein